MPASSVARPTSRADFAAIAARLLPGDWSASGLAARCAQQAVGLLRAGVTLSQLDAAWPGGGENADGEDLGPWVRCFAAYHHLGRVAAQATGGAGDASVQQTIFDGITDAPVYVECSDGETRAVYAKALPVHFALSAIDDRLSDPRLTRLEWLEHVLQWVWIVTTPGALAPFDVRRPITQWPAAAEPWLASLTEFDLLALVQAYNRVDRHAIAVLCGAFPRHDHGPSRLSLAGVFGTLAKEQDVQQFSAKRIFATTLSEVVAQQEAHDRAMQEADAKRAP